MTIEYVCMYSCNDLTMHTGRTRSRRAAPPVSQPEPKLCGRPHNSAASQAASHVSAAGCSQHASQPGRPPQRELVHIRVDAAHAHVGRGGGARGHFGHRFALLDAVRAHDHRTQLAVAWLGLGSGSGFGSGLGSGVGSGVGSGLGSVVRVRVRVRVGVGAKVRVAGRHRRSAAGRPGRRRRGCRRTA